MCGATNTCLGLPCVQRGIVAVGALGQGTGPNYAVAWFSNSQPTVSAPGVNILSAGANTQGLVALSGTSMATPHVAGAVCQWFACGTGGLGGFACTPYLITYGWMTRESQILVSLHWLEVVLRGFRWNFHAASFLLTHGFVRRLLYQIQLVVVVLMFVGWLLPNCTGAACMHDAPQPPITCRKHAT